jgi:hypothetical protein
MSSRKHFLDAARAARARVGSREVLRHVVEGSCPSSGSMLSGNDYLGSYRKAGPSSTKLSAYKSGFGRAINRQCAHRTLPLVDVLPACGSFVCREPVFTVTCTTKSANLSKHSLGAWICIRCRPAFVSAHDLTTCEKNRLRTRPGSPHSKKLALFPAEHQHNSLTGPSPKYRPVPLWERTAIGHFTK